MNALARANAGATNVLYGGGGGLSASGDQIWHQNSSGVKGGSETHDRFGGSLTSGDFNNDGYGDLAIGVAGEDIKSIANAGAANVLYGTSGGLSASRDQIWHQNSPGIKGGAEVNDLFGKTLASGDFNDDGYSDLAVGVPLEDIGAITNACRTNVIYGSASGLTATGDQVWHQGKPGIVGGVEARDCSL